eukprot:11215832-Lingulodinium_polyedra.AAC.1
MLNRKRHDQMFRAAETTTRRLRATRFDRTRALAFPLQCSATTFPLRHPLAVRGIQEGSGYQNCPGGVAIARRL